jgi:hypothetical protein
MGGWAAAAVAWVGRQWRQWRRSTSSGGVFVAGVRWWLKCWAPGRARLLDRIHLIYNGRYWAVVDKNNLRGPCLEHHRLILIYDC